MLTPDLFEELLAAYPAERRELARKVYSRFAEGDSTQFFSQLFIVLDIYAHYAERIPQSVVAANQSTNASLTKLRDEISLLAQGINVRDVNITKQAEKTNTLCHDAMDACDQITQKVASLVSNIGTSVNTQNIVDGIKAQLQGGIRDQIIQPFVRRTEELAENVLPTLEQINRASGEANKLWSRHIWRTAWAATFAVMFAVLLLATAGLYLAFRNYAERKTAEKIASVSQLLNHNRDAFQQLAMTQVPVRVVRTHDADGEVIPGGYALLIENVDNAEMQQTNGTKEGVVYFTSRSQEQIIQETQSELHHILEKMKEAAK